jgi:hypothetical protein
MFGRFAAIGWDTFDGADGPTRRLRTINAAPAAPFPSKAAFVREISASPARWTVSTCGTLP